MFLGEFKDNIVPTNSSVAADYDENDKRHQNEHNKALKVAETITVTETVKTSTEVPVCPFPSLIACKIPPCPCK